MSDLLNILVIEDRQDDYLLVERHLKKNGLSASCSCVGSLEGLKEAIDRESWDLVLADYNVPNLNFLDSLNLLRSELPDLPVIMVTGSMGEEKAASLLEMGVRDFVLKENLARLVPAVLRSLKEKRELVERRLAEERLRESEERYRGLVESQRDLIVRLDSEGIYTFVNDAYCKKFGVKREEIIGKMDYKPLTHPEDLPLTLEAIKSLEHPPHRAYVEERTMAVEGERWVGWENYAIRDDQGRIVEIQAVGRDIHDRKIAEQALRASEERLNLALRGANDGLWDWDLKTNEVYYSPRWKSMLGFAEGELENHYETWERLLHPEDLETALTRLRGFLEGRASRYEEEFRMRHKEGHYVDILSRGFLVYGDQGEAVRIVGTHVDVTERNKLEEQSRQAQKIEAVGQLAGGVAHDFNNILSAIFGYSDLLLAKLKEIDPLKIYVEQIIKASKSAAVLTQSLLAFSRKQEVALAVIDVSEVIKGFETFLRRLIREDIELKIRCAGEPLSVLADRGQIEQVLMNLVANGRDAMPNGGKLVIETLPATLDQEFVETHGYGKAGAYALFSVSDSGVGMDRETQSRIFEPFYTTKEQGKGTGLGLSMAYGIVKKHNGFINVYSEPGTGTIFKIYLPRVSGTAEADKRETEETFALRGGTETILVCEDDEDLRKLAVHVLSHFGYQVIEAVDGQDAVEKFIAHQENVDLVFMDAIMPKKNGKVAFQEMKIVRPDFKTIFASGYTSDIFEEDNPFDENTIFINKPYSPNDLLAKARELLDRK
jgi:PAS domain S-box-containing protein